MAPREKPATRLVPVPDLPADDEIEEIVTHWSDPDLLLFRTFRGHLKAIATDEYGNLTIRLGIIPQDKLDAFALSDFTGLVFTFDAYFKPRRTRTDDQDADEADAPDGNSDEDD